LGFSSSHCLEAGEIPGLAGADGKRDGGLFFFGASLALASAVDLLQNLRLFSFEPIRNVNQGSPEKTAKYAFFRSMTGVIYVKSWAVLYRL
jgi:hypothetical protein